MGNYSKYYFVENKPYAQNDIISFLWVVQKLAKRQNSWDVLGGCLSYTDMKKVITGMN